MIALELADQLAVRPYVGEGLRTRKQCHLVSNLNCGGDVRRLYALGERKV